LSFTGLRDGGVRGCRAVIELLELEDGVSGLSTCTLHLFVISFGAAVVVVVWRASFDLL
jgi:hypothetical protein